MGYQMEGGGFEGVLGGGRVSSHIKAPWDTA